MKRKDIIMIALAALIGAFISMLVSTMIFNSQANKVKVPVVDKISSTFPDVNNDTTYNRFLNHNALDPTQPIQIGSSSNSSPFNQGQ